MVGGGRAPCCDKKNVKKGPWSPAEDVRLVSFIQRHGHPNWRSLPKQAGLLRCGKSCRLRWINYLRPDVKRGNFTPQEELSIIRLHATFGNKWSKISSQLPGRTDNEIKNVWNTHLKKRAMLMANNNVNNNNETLLATPSSSSATSNVSTGTVYQHQNTNNGFKNQQHSSSLPLLHNEKQQAEVQTPKVMDKEEAADTHVLLPSTPSSTMPWNSCQRHDEAIENILEIPSEPEVEFWNMLDDIQLQSQEEQPISFPNESWIGQEMEVERWMRLLEDELGLVGPLASDQTKTKDDGCNPEIWCQVSDQISPLWPQHIGL